MAAMARKPGWPSINADTKLKGVKTFVKNHENDNPITFRPTATTVSVTNNLDGSGVTCFYMYRV